MAAYAPLGGDYDDDDGGDDGLVLHVVDGTGSGSGAGRTHKPLQMNSGVPVEFENDNFKGRCMFLHRPSWSYDSKSTATYAYKNHFHERKRLWEWRLQGHFKRLPGVVYFGAELEEYVPVNFATRTIMRGILPLMQAALQCKALHHELGRPGDATVRPVVVAPIWAADSTLIHADPAEAPDLSAMTLPTGLGRKAARRYWETLWEGGGPAWDGQGGPTFTFAVWGPSPLVDLRAWVFRKLPLTWGKDLSLEPFCGQQPVHGVIYELVGGAKGDVHRQPQKRYAVDVRIMPESVWALRALGEESSEAGLRPAFLVSNSAAVPPAHLLRKEATDGTESFCSALSRTDSDPDLDDLEGGLGHLLPSPRAPPARPWLASPAQPETHTRSGWTPFRFLDCCRRRRESQHSTALLL